MARSNSNRSLSTMARHFKKSLSWRTEKSSCLNYEQYQLKPPEYFKLCCVATGVCALVSYTFYRSLPVFVLSLPLAFAYPFYRRKTLKEKRKHTLLLEFKEAILIVASFLSAGYATENAFKAAIPELIHMFGEQAYIVQEFRLIVQGIQLNKPLEELLHAFGKRSGVADIRSFAEIFSVAKRSGGELVRIISHTAEVVRDKVAIEEEIVTLTASKRYEQRIMNMLPFFIILYMNFSSPEFFAVLYETVLGRVVMTLCLVVYAAAIYAAERIMAIEV